jgi:cardiolipin synthase
MYRFSHHYLTIQQHMKIHSKVMMIDDEICSVGSANMDYRSFALNFEVNAFIYDAKLR